MTLAERKNAASLIKYTTVTPFTYLLFPSAYKCLFCEEKFSEIQILLEHSRNHEIPDYNHILKKILKKGKKKMKVDISNLKCRICETEIQNLVNAQDHLQKNHDKKFTGAGSGMIEFNLETKDNLFSCHVCLKVYHSFFLLNKHMSEHYRNAVCETCGKSFLSYQRLLKHTESHKNGTYPCDKCHKTFPSVSKLKYHKDKIHGNLKQQKLAKCHKCGQRFEHHYEKIRHLKKLHGVEISFKCETCSVVFQTRHSLNMHEVKYHKQSIVCEICRKTFSERYHLKRHMGIHNQEQREERNYTCSLCNKCYRYEKTLIQHIQSHKPEWKYACSVCWIGFGSKTEFKTHKFTHL